MVTHTRPSGTGWVTGQQGEPVEIAADPPGDGIGPDLTPPDKVPGMDAKEYRRLERDHRAAVKEIGTNVLTEDAPELFETQHDEPTPSAFPEPPRAGEPEIEGTDPREQRPATKDPREGRGTS